MTDAGTGNQAQRPRFPKTLGDLTDASKCPSCFEAYTRPWPVCLTCGFTRDQEVLGELLELGAKAREPLLARGEFIVAANERARAQAAAEMEEQRAQAEQHRLQQQKRDQKESSDALLAADHAKLLGGAAGQFGGTVASAASAASVASVASAAAAPSAHGQTQAPAQRFAPQPAPASQQPPTSHPVQPNAFPPQQHQRPQTPQPQQPHPQPQQPQQPRRSSVQLLLLVLGIGLLSIAAVVFLTFAWVVFGVEVKAAITAGVTLAVVATASILKRRRLSATAEGIAVLGVVLITLDIWAVQATGLFGADLVPGTLYWGLGLLVATAAFEAWHRLAKLRTPGIAASLAILPAIALTAAGVTSSLLSPVQRLVLALVLAGAASALHVLLRAKQPPHVDAPGTAAPGGILQNGGRPVGKLQGGEFSSATPRSIERWILAVTGIVALSGGVLAGAAAATGNEPWLGYTFLFVVAAASAALLAWLVSQETGALGSRTLLISLGILTALALGAVPLSFTGAVRLALSLALIPISLAAVQVLRARLAASARQQAGSLQLAATAWTFTTLAAATIPVITLGLTVLPVSYFSSLIGANQAGMASAFAGADAGTWWAISCAALGLAGAAGLLQLAPGRLQQLTPALTATVSYVALCAAASIHGPLGVTLANLVVAGCAVVCAILLARHLATKVDARTPSKTALLVVLQCVAGISIVALLASGLALRPVEIAALTVGAALTFCLRFSTRGSVAQTGVSPQTGASALRLILTALTAVQLLAVPLTIAFVREAWTSPGASGTNLSVTCAYLGIALLITATLLLPRPWLAPAERTLLAYAAAVPTVVASLVLLTLARRTANGTNPGELLTDAAWPLGALWPISAAVALLLAVAFAVVAARRRKPDDSQATTPLLATLPPALWAGLAALTATFVPALNLPVVAASVGALAATLTAAGALTARLRGASTARVLPAEIAAGAVAILSLVVTPTYIGSMGIEPGLRYLAATTAVAAAAPILSAISPAGLFQAKGRSWLAWIGVGLLPIAWYLFALGTPSLSSVEGTSLPAGVPLVLAALLLWWFGTPRSVAKPATAAAGVLAGGLALSTVPPAVFSYNETAQTFTYFGIGAAVALAAAAATVALRPPVHARPLVVALSRTAGALAAAAVIPHLLFTLESDGARGGASTGAFPAMMASAEALLWLAALVLLALCIDWLLLRPLRETDAGRAGRKLLTTLIWSLGASITLSWILAMDLDATLLFVGLGLLAVVIGAALPAKLVTSGGRGVLALLGLGASLPALVTVLFWSRPTPGDEWSAEATAVVALLISVVAGAVVLTARTLTATTTRTRLPGYLVGVLGLWHLIHLTQLNSLVHTTPVQLAATAGVIGALTALLGVLLAPHGTRQGDGLALRILGLTVAVLGALLAPGAAYVAGNINAPGAPYTSDIDGPQAWAPLPLAVALVAVTAIVASAQLGARSPYAILRYLGVPILALAWVWEVLTNIDSESIFLAFGGAFLVLFVAGVATAGFDRRGNTAQPPGIESLLWLAAAPGVWLSAGAIAAVAQPSDAAGPRILALSVPEFTLALSILALVVVCAVVPVAGWMRASVNALGVGASISAAVLGPALALAATGPLTPVALPLWGVLPACFVLLFAGALWRRQHELDNPRLAALAATVLAPVAIAALVISAFPGILRGESENGELVALTWVLALCALSLIALTRPGLLPTLSSAETAPGARPSLRLATLAFSSATLVALVGVFGTQYPLRTLELATAPLSTTLLAGGIYFLAQRPELRSWAALTPGLVMLLVPSYLTQFADPAPWRLIALGLAAVGVTVWGATRRLQAPLVFGAIITVLHAVTAFRQQLAVVAGVVPWWAWLALAGTVLVVIATTYEARLRDAKRAAASIRSLR